MHMHVMKIGVRAGKEDLMDRTTRPRIYFRTRTAAENGGHFVRMPDEIIEPGSWASWVERKKPKPGDQYLIISEQRAYLYTGEPVVKITRA